MFRVGLIDTMDKTNSIKAPNISIVSLASYLYNNGINVEVLDLYFSDEKKQKDFFNKKWDLIGITSTSFAFPVARKVGEKIKSISSNKVPIIIGGPHASVARQDVFIEKWIDYAVYGEGEIPLLSIVKLLKDNPKPTNKKLKEINGLIFRDNDNIIINPAQERIKEIDSLPLPAYNLFSMEIYDSYSFVSSRGCPYQCVYCASQAILGKLWIAMKPERIIKEIKYIISNWGKKPFNLVDDTFNLNQNRIKEFCRLLIEQNINIKWNPCGIRADKTDSEMLKLMVDSGCDSVCVGIESANPDVLKNIGKKESLKEIEEGINKIKKVGINVCGMFMIGNPGDTKKSINQSIAFAKKLKLDSCRFYHAIPFPNTKLWDYVKEKGRFIREDYENFHDFSEEPIFETDDFLYKDRVFSYKKTMNIMFPTKRKLILKEIINLLSKIYSYFYKVYLYYINNGFNKTCKHIIFVLFCNLLSKRDKKIKEEIKLNNIEDLNENLDKEKDLIKTRFSKQ